jgi:hypothetical protein
VSTVQQHATPSMDLQLRSVDGAAVLVSLAQRRAAWLESSLQRTDDGDRSALDEIGGILGSSFEEAKPHAELLRRVFEEYGPWANERIGNALESGRFGEAERAAFARVTGVRDGDYASRGAALAAAFVNGVGDVAADLRTRLDGVVVAADGADWGCGLVAFGTMGGLMMCPKTLGVGCAIGAAGMITLAAFC